VFSFRSFPNVGPLVVLRDGNRDGVLDDALAIADAAAWTAAGLDVQSGKWVEHNP
jgi:hypothetical protein